MILEQALPNFTEAERIAVLVERTLVQPIFSRMTNPTAKEKQAIRGFVEGERLGGNNNWDLTDEEWIIALGATNSLVGLKNLTVSGTTQFVNSPTFDNQGTTFNGSNQYFDTGFIPSSDVSNASLNDISGSCYVKDNIGTSSAVMWGCTGSSSSLDQRQNFGTDIRGRVNSTAITAFPGESQYADDSMYGLRRDDSANQEIMKNGVEIDTEPDASVALPDVSIYVGASNNNGTPGTYMNIKLSTFRISASIGFDEVAHYDNVVQLLADLA